MKTGQEEDSKQLQAKLGKKSAQDPVSKISQA
jgi:hypothetical protein